APGRIASNQPSGRRCIGRSGPLSIATATASWSGAHRRKLTCPSGLIAAPKGRASAKRSIMQTCPPVRGPRQQRRSRDPLHEPKIRRTGAETSRSGSGLRCAQAVGDTIGLAGPTATALAPSVVLSAPGPTALGLTQPCLPHPRVPQERLQRLVSRFVPGLDTGLLRGNRERRNQAGVCSEVRLFQSRTK